jgi:hypothetical protein
MPVTGLKLSTSTSATPCSDLAAGTPECVDGRATARRQGRDIARSARDSGSATDTSESVCHFPARPCGARRTGRRRNPPPRDVTHKKSSASNCRDTIHGIYQRGSLRLFRRRAHQADRHEEHRQRRHQVPQLVAHHRFVSLPGGSDSVTRPAGTPCRSTRSRASCGPGCPSRGRPRGGRFRPSRAASV